MDESFSHLSVRVGAHIMWQIYYDCNNKNISSHIAKNSFECNNIIPCDKYNHMLHVKITVLSEMKLLCSQLKRSDPSMTRGI